MVAYSLRKADQNDFEDVYSIKIEAMKEYIILTWGWDEDLQKKFHLQEFKRENIFIIEDDSKKIGTIGINENSEEVVISRLYLIKEYQSRGIGSDIIHKIINENSSKLIRLGVLKINKRAKKLYEELGFVVCGEENNHWKMRLKF